MPRVAMHLADYAVARCLSVRLSATRRYCVKVAKRITVTNLFYRRVPRYSSYSVPNVMAIFRRRLTYRGRKMQGV